MLPGGTGHVLVTTRRGSFRALGSVLDLNVLDRSTAVTLLRRRAPHLPLDEAGELAEQLGDLPLALDQAAAFLDQTDTPPADYLDLLRTRAWDLFGRGGVADHQDTDGIGVCCVFYGGDYDERTGECWIDHEAKL